MNPFEEHLNTLLSRLTLLKHRAYFLDHTIRHWLANFTEKDKENFFSISKFVLTDWTGDTKASEHDISIGDMHIKKGTHFSIPILTNHSHVFDSSNYETEVESLMSDYFLYSFQQSYEALETFFKDVMWWVIQNDDKIASNNIKRWPKAEFSRENLKGGKPLFKEIINNCDLKTPPFYLDELYKVLSDIRHSITHSKSEIEKSIISESGVVERLYNHFFDISSEVDNKVLLTLDYKPLDKLIVSTGELGYYIYKSVSIKNEFEWTQQA